MKKLILVLFVALSTATYAQNFQLHRDFEREQFTSTFEFFKMDKYGNTFTFIDFDYKSNVGINQAYYEIARVIQTEKMPIGLHLEYNGGVNKNFSMQSAYLVGANYSKGTANWGFSTYLAYKQFDSSSNADVQVTGTWYWHLFEKKLTLIGFADLWTEGSTSVLLAEPQFWYNINKTFSLGGEVELSNNFAGQKGFYTRPTLGVKWNI